ncbi:MAG: VCBS repeat-containing protein [Gemmataceae bacterium]
MRRLSNLSFVVAAWISFAAAPAPAHAQKTTPVPASHIKWKKIVVDKTFRSEGVAVADFNKDGKLDIFVGDCWYEAPDWKRHIVRVDKAWNPAGYSESFACFVDDFNGDGYPDVIVIPFPGKECFWYENPGKAGGNGRSTSSPAALLQREPPSSSTSSRRAKVLVMGWQPPGKGNMGEMCYFLPGKDPTQPWEKHSISGPSAPGKEVPGTQRFSHGLGHGDVNGDGRVDILCTGGWWEQPEKLSEKPWTFHPANLGPACADMYAVDVNGDGKADVISSSAHGYGFWWYQQKAGKGGIGFTQNNLFLTPPDHAKESLKKRMLNPQEVEIFEALRKARDDERRAQLSLSDEYCIQAIEAEGGKAKPSKGAIVVRVPLAGKKPQDIAKEILEAAKKSGAIKPGYEIGFTRGGDKGNTLIAVIGPGRFSLPSETHALVQADINGDGLTDLVTGRRWWAHGGMGDPGAQDPPYVYWFEAKKGKDGKISYIPHEIDDDCGIGTMFVVIDINGDGLLDVVISNKRGVHILLQERENPAVRSPAPGSKD